MKNNIYSCGLSNLKRILKQVSKGALEGSANISFSQEGEDLVILRQITDMTPSYYVEVGALDPCRFSNTYLFYKLGWKGLLIEPNPSTAKRFHSKRPRDIFVNEGVSKNEQLLNYYQFEEPALNTFDSITATERISNGWKLSGESKIQTRPLKEIFKQFLPKGTKITILSIDVEGLDEEVILSNDWNLYRPKWVIVEILDTNLAFLPDAPIAKFLENQNYTLFAKTGHSVIFKEGGI